MSLDRHEIYGSRYRAVIKAEIRRTGNVRRTYYRKSGFQFGAFEFQFGHDTVSA